MRTRYEWFQLYEGCRHLTPYISIPVNDDKKLYIMNFERDKVVVIEVYEGYEVEDKDVHLHRLMESYDLVGENEYEINYYIVYRKKKYFLRDYIEKKEL